MEQKKGKLPKEKLRAIIVAAVSVCLALALIITNMFIPVKYLSGYLVARNKGAAEGVMRVRFVDVGYGDCTVVELPDGKNMLIDGGNGSRANQLRILKFLNKCAIDTIDYLVCTSVNSEYCGGLSEILQYKKVKNVYLPNCENPYLTDEFAGLIYTLNGYDAQLYIGSYGAGVYDAVYGYFFTFLCPTEGEADSSVLWLEYSGSCFMFTSDASEEELLKLCDGYMLTGVAGGEGFDVKLEDCDVLTLCGHGKSNGANEALLSVTRPEAVVASVGDNAEGAPSEDTLVCAKNYVQDNLYITRDYGTVTFEATEEGYSVV